MANDKGVFVMNREMKGNAERKDIQREILHALGAVCGLAEKWVSSSDGNRLSLNFRKGEFTLDWYSNDDNTPFSHEVYNSSSLKSKSFLAANERHMYRRTCTLMITRRCNLNCKYCYEQYKGSGYEMSFETARKCIEAEFKYVTENSDAYKELEFDFMGGEPFENFDLIRQVVEWLESVPRPIPYVCFASTNGTLICQHREWLERHKKTLHLGMSYDGTSEMQNENRGTGNNEDGLRLVKELYPEQSLHMVVSRETLPNLCKGLLDLHDKGYVADVALAQGVDWGLSDAQEYAKQLEQLSQAYLKNLDLQPVGLLVRPLSAITDRPDLVKQKKVCGTGGNMVAYDYNGKKYACHLFTPVVLGERARELADTDFSCESAIEDPECRSCVLKMVCPTCVGFNYRFRGILGLRDHRWCRMVLVQAKAACAFQLRRMNLIDTPSEEEMRYLKGALEALPILEKLQDCDPGPYSVNNETERRNNSEH